MQTVLNIYNENQAKASSLMLGWRRKKVMKHQDFTLNLLFTMGGRTWIVTDVGTRTVIAMLHSDYLTYGTPPNGCCEEVLDWPDWDGCSKIN